MSPEHLRYYLAFAETGSLHAAARQVGRSPAALSKALAQLQSDVGRTLVATKGRGLVLTAEGRDFVDRSKDALRTFDALVLPRTPSPRRLRLGTFEVFSTHWVPELVEGDGELELRELGPGQLERALLAGEVDVGLTYSPVPTRGVDARSLGEIPMKIFARIGAFRGISTDELPFVVPLASMGKSPTRIRGLDGWPAGRPRRVVASVTLLESALALVRAGRCVAYLPEPLVQRHNTVVAPRFRLEAMGGAQKIRNADRTRVFLLHRTGEPLSPEGLALELRMIAGLTR